jgi:hypothetical protein
MRGRVEPGDLWPPATEAPLLVLRAAAAGGAGHSLEHLVSVPGREQAG